MRKIGLDFLFQIIPFVSAEKKLNLKMNAFKDIVVKVPFEIVKF